MSLEDAQNRHKNIGRNDPCPCESGKKYKKCHHAQDTQTISDELKRLAKVAEAEAAALAAAEAEKSASKSGKDATGGKASQNSQLGKRSGQASGKGSARGGSVAKAQSLPRRGAV